MTKPGRPVAAIISSIGTICCSPIQCKRGWCTAEFLFRVGVFVAGMRGRRPTPAAALDFGFQSSLSLVAARRQLLALDLAWCAKSKTLDDKRIVVLLFAFLVGPIVGANMRLQNELITLARVFRDRFPETLERNE